MDIIGRFISKNASGSGTPSEECLSAEEIAGFIDGCLHGDAHSRAVAHLADCRRCYSIYVDSLAMVREGTETENPKQVASLRRRFLFYAFPTALAAGIAMFLVYQNNTPQQQLERGRQQEARQATGVKTAPPETIAGKDKEVVPQTAAKPVKDSRMALLVARLEARRPVAALAERVSTEQQASLGFSGGSNRERTAFRLGTLLVDLAVAARAGDREKERLFLARIADLAEAEPEYAAIAKKSSDLRTRSMRGKDIRGAALELDRLLDGKADSFFLEMGMWTEGGLIMARAGDGGFAVAGEAARYTEGVILRGISKEAADALAGIESILRTGAPDKKGTRKLQRLFEKVRESLEG